MNLPSLKQAAFDACMHHVNERIETARQAMEHAQQAANQEGKSSAGDKYETGRAMMQIERDKAAQQLAEAIKLRTTLQQLSSVAQAKTVSMGSLIITDSQKIFISIGIGKIIVENEPLLVVGPLSPLAQAFKGKTTGDSVTFNNEVMIIRELG